MKKLLLIFALWFSFNGLAQTNVVTNNSLTIKHGDLTIYLTDDTCTMVSKHVLKYKNFKKIDSDRDNKWFQDTYKGKYNREFYKNTGYDLGHLTPSHITSYNDSLNHDSFSLFNQAPQIASFNRGKWAQLEKGVEDSIAKYKSNAVIITGVIYDPENKEYLGKSRIPIPIAYFKVLVLKKNTYAWIGSNNNGTITTITIKQLNEVFVINKMNFQIN
jgi:DNA/RNA endonuclease G (NUC1)